MPMYYVYSLIDPSTSQTRYVGVTSNPRRRLSAHLSRQNKSRLQPSALWIAALDSKGLAPIMRVEAMFSERSMALREEESLISGLRSAGAELLNVLSGGRNLGGRHTESSRLSIGIHSKERARGRPLSYYDNMREAQRKVVSRPVENSDGEVFASIVEAARTIGVTPPAVRHAIRGGWKCRNRYWNYKQ